VVSAVHEPSDYTLDCKLAPLVNAYAKTKACNSAEVLVVVLLDALAAKRSNDVLCKQLGLANSVLSVWYAEATNTLTG